MTAEPAENKRNHPSGYIGLGLVILSVLSLRRNKQVTPPIKPGLLIKEKAREAGYTQKSLAEALGTSQPFVSDLLTGKRAISNLMAMRLSKVLGLPPHEWLYKQVDYELYMLRGEEK